MSTRQKSQDLEIAVLDAAIGWWEGHRPVRWTEAEHLKHPAINTTTDAESWLARVVSDLVQDQPNR